jgi:hypothetical protein
MRFAVVPNIPLETGENIEAGRKVTIYDVSPYAVKREQLGLTPTHNGTEVSIFGSQDLDPKRHPAFKQKLKFFLPCVRRRTVELHEFDSTMMDADNIILVKVRFRCTRGAGWCIYSLAYLLLDIKFTRKQPRHGDLDDVRIFLLRPQSEISYPHEYY